MCAFTQNLGEMIQFDEHIFFGESFDLIFQARGHFLSIMSFWQRLGNPKMVFPDSSSFVKHHGPILLESYYLSQSNSDESLMKRQSPWSNRRRSDIDKYYLLQIFTKNEESLKARKIILELAVLALARIMCAYIHSQNGSAILAQA